MPKIKPTIDNIKDLIDRLPKENFYTDSPELTKHIDSLNSNYSNEYYDSLRDKMTELYDSKTKKREFYQTLVDSPLYSEVKERLISLNPVGIYNLPEIEEVVCDPEKWKVLKPYYEKFILIYNDLCSFKRMNMGYGSEVKITWDTNYLRNFKKILQIGLGSVDDRLTATSFIFYNSSNEDQMNWEIFNLKVIEDLEDDS
jgi:hypothetical protein